MILQDELLAYLESYLDVSAFADYGPNGLQVQGPTHYKKIVTGVTASLAMIEAAIDAGADCLLVHHGIFWKGDPYPLVGFKGARVAKLMNAKLALLAYHLPLDAHEEVGNNVQLANKLGITLSAREGSDIYVRHGHLATPLSGAQFAEKIAKALQRDPLHIPGRAQNISRVAWCTGAGHKALQSLAPTIDAYITGEISESTVHIARELGVHLFAAGHHATERYGVQALGEHLQTRFGLQHQFIDIDSPI